ncbi:MAG TPA: type IV secretion IcmS family protein [Gammaproteobacteria bacterium]|jgi:intracellular multiplication protein IcmS|nr:type IV secretion IcmS family protein [Gammaproteobacteria bacterium]
MATSDLSQQMMKIARTMNRQYSLNGRPFTHEEVFSTRGLMPGLAKRADQLSVLCLGYGLGVTFEQTEGTPLGVTVVFDDVTPNTLRLLCLVDVLYELIKGSFPGDLASLDQLLYD